MLQSIHFLSSQQHWIVPFQMNKLIILNTIQHYVWNQLLCKDYLKWILLFVWVRNDSWFLFKCYCHFLFIMFFVWFLFLCVMLCCYHWPFAFKIQIRTNLLLGKDDGDTSIWPIGIIALTLFPFLANLSVRFDGSSFKL